MDKKFLLGILILFFINVALADYSGDDSNIISLSPDSSSVNGTDYWDGENKQLAVKQQSPRSKYHVVKSSYFDGAYLGAGLNFVHVNGKAKLNSSYVDESQYSGRRSFPLSSFKFGLAAFGGYGKILNQKFYLGGELFANYSPMRTLGSKHYNTSPRSNLQKLAEVKSYFDLGAGIRGGYLLSDQTMLYLLLAADYGQFKLHSNEVPNAYNLQYGRANDSGRETKNIIGFMPGVGMEMLLYRDLFLRFQYTYTIYPSFTDSYPLNTSSGVVHEKAKYNLSKNNFMVSLSYRFSPKTNDYNISPIAYYQSFLDDLSFRPFYIGLAGNVLALHGSAEEMTTRYNSTGFGTYNIYEDHRLSSYDPGISLFVGYGKDYKHFYFGPELFAYYGPMESKVTLDSGRQSGIRSKIKTNNILGGDLRFGYLLTPSAMVYAVLGVGFTKFKITSQDDNGVDSLLPTTTKELTKNRALFMPGLGVEAMIYKNLSLRIQYIYSLCKEITDNYYQNWWVNVDPQPKKTKYNPSIGIFTVGLSYYF